MSETNPTPKKSYVWWSSEQSRAAGQVSILGIFETILCVGLFWWFVHAFDFYWLLITSVFLTFFVLLRSPESVAKGRDMFFEYEESKSTALTPTVWFKFTAAVVAAMTIGWFIGTHWLDAHEGWAWFWRVACLGYLIIILSTAFTGAIALVVAESNAVVIASASGILIGVLLRAGFIRFWATLRHLHKGVPCFAKNWTALTFHTDWKTHPELIPGLPENNDFSFRELSNDIAEETNRVLRLYFFLLAILIFFPSITYRYYLKSTAWIYFPLIWIAKQPKRFDGKFAWDKSQTRGFIPVLGFLMACVIVLITGLQLFDLIAVGDTINLILKETDLPVHPLVMITAFDFGRLKHMEWLPLSSATLTILIFIWASRVHSQMTEHEDYEPQAWKTWVNFKLSTVKMLLTVSWISVGIYELGFVLHASCKNIGVFRILLDVFFDPSGCPVL